MKTTAAAAATPVKVRQIKVSERNHKGRSHASAWLAEKWGLLGLAALAALIPVGVIFETNAHIKLEPLLSQAFSTGQPFSLEAEAIGNINRRRLQTTDEEPVCNKVTYTSQLELYMCITAGSAPVPEGAEPLSLTMVNEEQIIAGCSSLMGLGYPDPTMVRVVKSQKAAETTDPRWCTEGNLQWHVQVQYPADARDASQRRRLDEDDYTPAKAAAMAVDHITYSGTFIQELIAAVTEKVNTNRATPAHLTESLETVSSGFICSFVNEVRTTAVGPAAAQGAAQGIVVEIQGQEVWWPAWAWLLYLLVVLLCLLPLCFVVCRKRRIIEQHEMEDDLAKKERGPEGLQKIYGPEWGITELDFEDNFGSHEMEGMEQEYRAAVKLGSAQPTSTRHVLTDPNSPSPARDVTDAAWGAEARERGEWAQGTPRVTGTHAAGASDGVRKFDIDADDEDKGLAFLDNLDAGGGSKKYSFSYQGRDNDNDG
ncbi:unnamed protein product [Chrysoparadoxa australica]